MRYLWQHIGQILQQYRGNLPLHHFLKSYFSVHPKLGSRDRRAISQAVYSWYRAGKALAGNENRSQQDLVSAAMYLCGGVPKILSDGHWEPYIDQADLITQHEDFPAGSMRELRKSGWMIDPSMICPIQVAFSAGIDKAALVHALLRQPRLFLRIRKNKEGVSTILQKADIIPEWLTNTCLALPNGTKIEGLLPTDCYVVQDASSQATGKYLQALPTEQWWDCCSGAGGKSLMLKDAAPGVQLLATDVRRSILNNLQMRFRLYHHQLPEMRTLDVADQAATAQALGNRRFDGIICDVPCSGSGTWARTPENCYFFDPLSLETYTKRQRDILRNACTYLTEGGRIIYITCSVFRAENEDVIEAIANERNMRIVSAGLINGLATGADALFAAELRHA